MPETSTEYLLSTERSAYAEEFLRAAFPPVHRLRDGETKLHATVFDYLARVEEQRESRRDRWGNWDWMFVQPSSRDVRVPTLDVQLQQALGVSTTPRWPDGRPFALCLTHDVDAVSSTVTIETLRRALASLVSDGPLIDRGRLLVSTLVRYAAQSHRNTDPLARYDEWLTMEDRHGFRSTFFFFPSNLSRPHVWDASYSAGDRVHFRGRRMSSADMSREIAAAGWEVGLHGSYHSATDASMLANERSQIEAWIGESVTSVRQHYLHYDAWRTPAVHEAAGLRVDSTHGFNSNIGFRAGTAFPYRVWDPHADRATSVMDIPLHVMDSALLSHTTLHYGVDEAIDHGVTMLDRVATVGGCLTLNWHPQYIGSDAHVAVYRSLLEEAARRGAWGASARDVDNWWRARLRSAETASSDEEPHGAL